MFLLKIDDAPYHSPDRTNKAFKLKRQIENEYENNVPEKIIDKNDQKCDMCPSTKML